MIGMLDGLVTVKPALLLGDAGEMPEAFAGKQEDEKDGDKDKRHRGRMLLCNEPRPGAFERRAAFFFLRLQSGPKAVCGETREIISRTGTKG